MGKIAEIVNLIRDEELTTGEIDYLMVLLNDKKHAWEVAGRDEIIKRFREDEAKNVRARIEKRQKGWEAMMSSNYANQCLDCIHYRGQGIDGGEHCEAFPEPGPPIPGVIWRDVFIHDQPYRSQQNEVPSASYSLYDLRSLLRGE